MADYITDTSSQGGLGASQDDKRTLPKRAGNLESWGHAPVDTSSPKRHSHAPKNSAGGFKLLVATAPEQGELEAWR
jgi:hypothetical protein